MHKLETKHAHRGSKFVLFKESCQVKKELKIREKIGLARPNPPTPTLSFFKFIYESCTKHTQNDSLKIKIRQCLR